MRFLWNLLGLIGLVAVIGAGALLFMVRGFDSGAPSTYYEMTKKIIATGNGAEATVWKRQVAEGLSFEDVHDSIKSTAQENNIKDVGFLPLGDQVSQMNGKPWRKLNIYLYCNPLTAQKMVDYSDAFSAYLPCRVSLLEDKQGKLWLYTLNMDMMIHGGKTLPPALLKEANEVKRIILDILDKASSGDF